LHSGCRETRCWSRRIRDGRADQWNTNCDLEVSFLLPVPKIRLDGQVVPAMHVQLLSLPLRGLSIDITIKRYCMAWCSVWHSVQRISLTCSLFLNWMHSWAMAQYCPLSSSAVREVPTSPASGASAAFTNTRFNRRPVARRGLSLRPPRSKPCFKPNWQTCPHQ
jgi:hypothetical protein